MSKHTLPKEYSVDKDGVIYSMTKWRGLPKRALAQTDHQGYLCVRVRTSCGKRERRMVHQIVCHGFNGPRPSNNHDVCHIDGNPKNNSAENLRWGTRKENAADRERHGRTSRGFRHGDAIKASRHKELVIRGKCHCQTKAKASKATGADNA